MPPPVDVARFEIAYQREDYFLLASRMVPYKCMDIVVSAFADMPDRKLVVIGDGPEKARVLAAARGKPNISFVGTVNTTELVRFMQRARAFVFAAEEDFEIMMVEAQACGTPVIAYSRGGARDILSLGSAHGFVL